MTQIIPLGCETSRCRSEIVVRQFDHVPLSFLATPNRTSFVQDEAVADGAAAPQPGLADKL